MKAGVGMAKGILQQVREAVSNLNPNEVRESAERPLHIGVAASSADLAALEDFLAPSTISTNRRWELFSVLHRIGDTGAPEKFDLEIYAGDFTGPDNGGYRFSPRQPRQMVEEILERREELGLPLSRCFPPFRRPVVEKIIFSVSRENGLFALATALPDVAPGLQLPWAVGEFASDTAFLTVNQIRMAFLVAAASDQAVGYREQAAEIASIIAGAFGWRALARELAGKLPLGVGLIPKAAIAFAGTFVVGHSLERLYRTGHGYTREERKQAYGGALERGRHVAASLLDGLRKKRGGASAQS